MNVVLKLTVMMFIGALLGLVVGIYLFENYWPNPFTIAISGTLSTHAFLFYGLYKWVE